MQVTGRRWKKQHRLNFATKKHGGSKKQEGSVHEHWEEAQAAAKTWGFPAVGKRQEAPAPAASSLHALEWVPSWGQRKGRSAWYALHIPLLSKAGAGGWLCASQEAVRKQYPAIAMATTGCARSELVPSVRNPAAVRPDSAGAQGPEPFPAASQRCDPDSQPGESTPQGIFLVPKGFLRRFPSGDET